MKNAYRINSLLQLIPRRKFDQLCEKWQMDKGVRNFSTWEQTCALILTYILELKSYREVELTLGIARSTFSDANSRRSHGFFEELCQLILLEIRTASTSRKVRRAIKNLIALDASEMSVHGSLFYLPGWQWKSTSKRKAGIKFSALFNVDGEWIEDFRISLVRSHDSPISKQFEIKRDKIYVFDRGYTNFVVFKIDFNLSFSKPSNKVRSSLHDLPPKA